MTLILDWSAGFQEGLTLPERPCACAGGQMDIQGLPSLTGDQVLNHRGTGAVASFKKVKANL